MEILDVSHVILLSSASGNRSVISYALDSRQNTELISNIAYNEKQMTSLRTTYQLMCMAASLIILIEFDYYEIDQDNEEQVQIRTFNNGKDGWKQQAQFIYSTKITDINDPQTQVLKIIGSTDMIAYVRQDQLIMLSSHDLKPVRSFQLFQDDQFKIKFVYCDMKEVLVVVKDRIDKFYKYLQLKQEQEHLFAKSFGYQEIIEREVVIGQRIKSSSNVIINNNQLYLTLSNIYLDQMQELYVNMYLLDHDQFKLINSFRLLKDPSIQFLQKDQQCYDYLLYKGTDLQLLYLK